MCGRCRQQWRRGTVHSARLTGPGYLRPAIRCTINKVLPSHKLTDEKAIKRGKQILCQSSLLCERCVFYYVHQLLVGNSPIGVWKINVIVINIVILILHNMYNLQCPCKRCKLDSSYSRSPANNSNV